MTQRRIIKRRRGKRAGRRLRRTNGSSSYYLEAFSFSVQAGYASTVIVGTLANRPPRSNFRPRWMRLQAVTLEGVSAPAAIQLLFMDPSDQRYNASSRIQLVGMTPNHLMLHMPSNAGWFSYDIVDSTPVARINCICTAKGSSVTIEGIITMRVDIQTEILAATCPTLHLSRLSNIRLDADEIRMFGSDSAALSHLHTLPLQSPTGSFALVDALDKSHLSEPDES